MSHKYSNGIQNFVENFIKENGMGEGHLKKEVHWQGSTEILNDFPLEERGIGIW